MSVDYQAMLSAVAYLAVAAPILWIALWVLFGSLRVLGCGVLDLIGTRPKTVNLALLEEVTSGSRWPNVRWTVFWLKSEARDGLSIAKKIFKALVWVSIGAIVVGLLFFGLSMVRPLSTPSAIIIGAAIIAYAIRSRT